MDDQVVCVVVSEFRHEVDQGANLDSSSWLLPRHTVERGNGCWGGNALRCSSNMIGEEWRLLTCRDRNRRGDM